MFYTLLCCASLTLHKTMMAMTVKKGDNGKCNKFLINFK